MKHKIYVSESNPVTARTYTVWDEGKSSNGHSSGIQYVTMYYWTGMQMSINLPVSQLVQENVWLDIQQYIPNHLIPKVTEMLWPKRITYLEKGS